MTAPKERPILFSGPMVRSILAGEKTQTRRVVKQARGRVWPYGDGEWATYGEEVHVDVFACPYGKPGDRLWVRETWAEHHPVGIQPGRFSMAGRAGIPGPPRVAYRVIYRADGDPIRVWHCGGFPYRTVDGPSDEIDARHPSVCSEFPGWRPSIHMPRWASRILLEVTDVRVERVQDISEADCYSEGLPIPGPYQPGTREAVEVVLPAFRDLWDSINAKRGQGWDVNPWVWVVEFKRLEAPRHD